MRKMFVAAAAGMFATSLVGSLAIAQTGQEVVVQATRIMEKNVGRAPATGAPINDVSLSYGVSYSGLDLASHAGAMELEKRVSDAAKSACKELTQKYPNATPSEAECTKAAIDKAMVRVRELEAAAAKK